jgi:hypothetical protein
MGIISFHLWAFVLRSQSASNLCPVALGQLFTLLELARLLVRFNHVARFIALP